MGLVSLTSPPWPTNLPVFLHSSSEEIVDKDTLAAPTHISVTAARKRSCAMQIVVSYLYFPCVCQ